MVVSAKRSLIWLLIWCLMVEPMAASIARAQVPPTPVPSTTSDDAADDAADHAVQQLVDRGEALNRDLETQIRRVKHPGTPGTQAGTPTSFDVGALEARILAFRQEAEAGLALPQLPQADGSPYWAVDLKLTVVNQYFNLLKELINLRMVMGLGHGDGWRQGFDLRMPAQALRQLPGMGVANDPKAGDTFFPMVFVPGPADGQVSLRLSKSLIRGMELGRLTDSPDQANFLTMVQYLAVRQLMQNLSEIKYVRRDHQMTWPEFPSDFTHKLESFGVMDDLEAEQEVALLEPALRTNLQRQFENIKAQLPPIVDDAFCGSMADVILGGGTAEEDRQELSGLLCSSMREAEDKNLAAYLNQEFTSASEILELQNGPELRDSLRFILMNARVNVILRKLLAMNSAHVISVPLSIRRALMPLVETRRGWMSAGTPDSVLDGWGHAAKTALESYVYDQRRAEFIENLYVQARSVGAIYDHRVGDDYVDLPVLSSSLAKKIEKRSPKQATRGWIADVAGAGDYAAARDRYAAIMAEQTYPGVLRDGGVVDPGLVKLYTDVADLRPHPDTSGIALECTA
ncbi:MAG TPA: hypothetical protein VL588_09805, partial [Bdellovibrionota bacterium]|nr:hypothetical protein [Bdellovibrionota bacterium]